MIVELWVRDKQPNKPNYGLAWMNLGVYLTMCEHVVPYFLVEIMPNSWVEFVLRY